LLVFQHHWFCSSLLKLRASAPQASHNGAGIVNQHTLILILVGSNDLLDLALVTS
jgi:hypothetical protein